MNIYTVMVNHYLRDCVLLDDHLEEMDHALKDAASQIIALSEERTEWLDKAMKISRDNCELQKRIVNLKTEITKKDDRIFILNSTIHDLMEANDIQNVKDASLTTIIIEISNCLPSKHDWLNSDLEKKMKHVIKNMKGK